MLRCHAIFQSLFIEKAMFPQSTDKLDDCNAIGLLSKNDSTFWAKSIYFSAKRYTPFSLVACISFEICAQSHSNIGQIMLQNALNRVAIWAISCGKNIVFIASFPVTCCPTSGRLRPQSRHSRPAWSTPRASFRPERDRCFGGVRAPWLH